jgi:hypothetical protein
MKKILALASAIVAVMLLTGAVPMIGIVKAAIPIPHNNWGHPYDETMVQMSEGELITSWIDGVEYGRIDTFLFAAEVWYDVDTAGNWITQPGDPNSPWEKEGGDLGEPVMYSWGDMTNIKLDPGGDGQLDFGVFEEYDLWWSSAVNETNINLSAAADLPVLYPKISQIIPDPTDGLGPDYVLIYTENTFFPMDQFYLEKNDGVLNGPTQTLTGVSNATANFYANLTNPAMDLDPCGDELKLVWSNTGPAFGGMDIVVDRVEWNATVGGTHFTEPDNTIMTDATPPVCSESIRRTGTFPIYADDTNDNAVDFIVDNPWPRPIPSAPNLAWNIPTGVEDWTGNMDHNITFTVSDANAKNDQLWLNVSYQIVPGAWNFATLNVTNPDFRGWGDASNPMTLPWSVPAGDSTVAQLEVCAMNPSLMSTCLPLSPQFEVDTTPPSVLPPTDPFDGETGVEVTRTITITFDELVDTSSVMYTIQPIVGGLSNSSPTNDVLLIDHLDLTPGTTYWVNITNACDDSVTGNCMVTPYSFSFETYIITPPAVDLTAPVGGEVWSGGSPHNIEWLMWHNGTGGLGNTDVTLRLICDGNPIIIDQAAGNDPTWNQPYPWTVQPLDSTNCVINVTIRDLDDNEVRWDESPAFEIDSTAPTVTGTNPMDAQPNVAVTTTYEVTFDEAIGTAGWFTMEESVSGTVVTGALTTTDDIVWTFTPDADLAYSIEYTVTISTGACDDSDPGNCLAATEIFTFTTVVDDPPTVDVTAPAGLETFGPGQTLTITWNMTDDITADADMDYNVSYDVSGTLTSITNGTGAETYDWTVVCPVADAVSTVMITVEVEDNIGQTGSDSSGQFTIDCLGPTATIVGPASEDEDVEITWGVSNPSETISTYSWSFEPGGALGTGAAPTYTYANDGTYTVTLTMTDEYGNTGTATHSITIDKVAEPGFDIMDYLWIIIIIIVVVIIAIIALAKRKKPEEEEEVPVEEEEEYEEEEPEEEELVEEEEEFEEEEVVEEEEPEYEEEAAPEAAPAAAAPAAEEAAPAEEAPAGETKECPSCGTVVPGDATECFLCGATL